ncbi:hypothetical protein SAMN04487891_106111 [Flagellimonas taeanensis]|jgi:hypothetical protein|uniref:Uncharacterized protein n=2 Tax=Flavobacteriales TaxID=200644 RepID=A0A1M6YYN7_9FLAO|nr:hypothetical protein SAMN04487891_106111 [Allomuricauda taeanensis]SHL23414.1 hypothetical protein SAMN05216293_3009 [Allomuricauda taeanensis]
MYRTGHSAIPNVTFMKTILLLITVLFSSMAISSCTNDEGETEFDRINPEEEQQATIVKTEQKEKAN